MGDTLVIDTVGIKESVPGYEGKVYRDDIGQCWPAGLPLIMTRVWPIAMMQYPTAISQQRGRIDPRRTARRQVRRQPGGRGQQQRRTGKRPWIERLHPEQEAAQQPRAGPRPTVLEPFDRVADLADLGERTRKITAIE